MIGLIMVHSELKRFFPFLITISLIAYFIYLVLDFAAMINTISLKHALAQRTIANNNNINSDDDDNDNDNEKLLIKKSIGDVFQFRFCSLKHF